MKILAIGTHFDFMLKKASSRMYILHVCMSGYSTDELTAMFDSLIMPFVLYGLEVWGECLSVY